MAYIKGIDVSNNNGSINFSKVAADGVEYVYVKATEGATFKDSYMKTFYDSCKNNNLKIGAYHFLVSTSTPEAQADNFYNTIKNYSWELIPMLDVESSFSSLTNYVVRFINRFRELSSMELGIYTYTSFISNLNTIKYYIKDLKLWEANYNNIPWKLSANFFTNRIGHQYTETGIVNGVNGYCDLNSFTEEVSLDSNYKSGQWIYEENKWWYKHNDGSYTKNGWEKISGKWYLFDEYGWMEYGWQYDENNWYFLGGENDGAMKIGWILSDNIWYYFDENGAMQTGWENINNKWYYFNQDGAMQTGWIKDDGKDYLLYSNGEMAHDVELYGYRFDSNGCATKL